MGNNQRKEKALLSALEALSPYWDNVQIFCSNLDEHDSTCGQTSGKGNIFARLGQIKIWLKTIEESLAFEQGGQDDEEEENNA